MITDKKLDSCLKLAAFITIAAMALFQIIAQRGLFADGSFQLLNFLETEGPKGLQGHGFFGQMFHEFVTSNNEPTRYFTYLFTELPTVIALRLGVTNIHVLIYIFSGWLTFLPLLLWGWGSWKLRQDPLFWPYLLMFSVVYFSSNFFSIGEYNLSYALTACCLALMLRAKANKPWSYVLLAILSFISIMSYAATLFLGVLLGALALKNGRDAPRKMKLYWIAIAAFFVASVAVGIWAYFHPANAENFANASNPYALLHNAQIWVTLMFAAIAALQLFTNDKNWLRSVSWGLGGVAVIILFGSIQSSPYTGYSIRAFTGLILFGFAIGLVAVRYFGKYLTNQPGMRYFAAPVFSLLLVLSLLDMRSSIEFRHFLNNYEKTVDSHTGFIRFEDTVAFIPDVNTYGWGWTYPSLGILLRRNTSAAIVLDPAYQKGRWAPFTPSSVPDLSRYYRD